MAKKSTNKSKVTKSKVAVKAKVKPTSKAPTKKKVTAPAKPAKAKAKPIASKKPASVTSSAKKATPKPASKKPGSKIALKPAKPVASSKTGTKSSAKPLAISKPKSMADSKAKPAPKIAAKVAPKAAASKMPAAKAPASKPIAPKANGLAPKKPVEAVAAKVAKEPVNRIVEPKQTISAEDLARFKAILVQKRRRLMGDVAMMSEEALGSEEGSVDNHAPIHPAEVGSHSFEQEFTLDLLSHDGDRIQMIEMALEKLDEGTYGQCDECSARIPKGRLEMLPESIYCVKCATKMEGSRF